MALDEIVSFTSPLNEPSWRVMERLGMSHDPADDFEHPRVPAGHPLRLHVLYRLSRAAWQENLRLPGRGFKHNGGSSGRQSGS
jgi:RimJ/RimL family protein N-acetyltransferase